MILENVDTKSFGSDFLKAYLEDGFSSMPKKEIDLLVLRLLVEHTDGWTWTDPPSAFTLAQKLRVKRGRIRSMLDELSFRNSMNEELTRTRLCTLIQRGERDSDGKKVRIQIEDGYLREYAKSLVQAEYGIVDTSFDRSIISLSADKFVVLVASVVDEKTKEKIEEEIIEQCHNLSRTEEKSLVRRFVEGAASGAGEEAGSLLVKLGFAAVTGGLSEIPGLIKAVTGVGDRDDSASDSVEV